MKYGKEIVISRGQAIELSVLKNVRVAVVRFDARDSRVNVLSTPVMDELDGVLDAIAALAASPKNRVCGAVFCSGKPDSFIVGADINEIVMAQSMPEAAAYEGCQKGKAILAKLSALPIPTVAAIHGRCLGGGTELALACHERVASDSKSTVVGLPEVGLGVLPGWGGTVRATKMLGFAGALPLILNPLKAWPARRAWESGLVSEVVPEPEFFGRAISLALGEMPRAFEPSLKRRTLRKIFDHWFGRAVASQAVKLAIKVQTRGKYPAPLAALGVMNKTFDLPEDLARDLESRTFALLCQTSACKECVQKFMDYQKAKKAKAATSA